MGNHLARISLLRKFAAIGIVMTLVIAVGMAFLTSREITHMEIEEAADLAGYHVSGVVAPLLEPGDLDDPLSGERYREMRLALQTRMPDDIVRVKIWSPQHVLLYSDDESLVGRQFPGVDEVPRAMAGETVAHLEEMTAAENEQEAAHEELLEVYAPLTVSWSDTPVGVYEIYRDPSHLNAQISRIHTRVWAASAAGFALLFAALFLLVRNASRRLVDQNERLMQLTDETIEGFARALDRRDEETEGHSRRVTDITVHMLRRLGLPEEEVQHGRRGALLHDIGKLVIPDGILLKPGPLHRIEWEVMKTHTMLATEILESIDELRPALAIPRHHHEKWDGSGYPDGLSGENIPLVARAFALADVWDALSSDRPYRSAWPQSKVQEYIAAQAGAHFDPELVPIFLEIVEEYTARVGLPVENVARRRKATATPPAALPGRP